MMYISHGSDLKPIVIWILVDNGIKINHLDNDGWNVLSYAASKKIPLSIWETLLYFGANVRIVDNYGKNIIERVLYRYGPNLPEELIKTLIEGGFPY